MHFFDLKMEQFLKNLVHFTHGMTLIFFVMMSIYFYGQKKNDKNNNRLFIFLFWESVFWMFIHFKDIVYLMDIETGRDFISKLHISIDTWCIPATFFLLMEITQPRRLTVAKMTLLMLPSVLLTAAYLSDYLNKNLSTTFYEYVNTFRVMEACDILSKGDYTIMEEAAEKSGFNSLSTFHRAFLKVMKMTPLQYRNRK